jgi:hypothetical protein
LSLSAWGDIAQFGIVIAGICALIGAVIQIKVMRSHARRARVYAYSDRFNQPEMIALSARYTDYWETHTYSDFMARDREGRSEWLVLANFIEEVAGLYNRKLLDRDIAAQVLGVYVEVLWKCSLPLVTGARQERKDGWLFVDWEQMQADTLTRRMAARRKTERRWIWHSFVQYWRLNGEIPPEVGSFTPGIDIPKPATAGTTPRPAIVRLATFPYRSYSEKPSVTSHT